MRWRLSWGCNLKKRIERFGYSIDQIMLVFGRLNDKEFGLR